MCVCVCVRVCSWRPCVCVRMFTLSNMTISETSVKFCDHSRAFSFDCIFFILSTIKSRTNLKFGQVRPRTADLPALERLEKFPENCNVRNVVATLATSFLIGSSSFLRVTRTTINQGG